MGLNQTMNAVSVGEKTPSTIPSFTTLQLIYSYKKKHFDSTKQFSKLSNYRGAVIWHFH